MEDYGSRSVLSSYSTASQKISESQDQESRELQLSCSDYEPGYIPPCPSADYSIQVHKPKASLSPNSILAGRCYCCGPRSPRVATIAWISVAIVFTVVIWSLPILVHCLPVRQARVHVEYSAVLYLIIIVYLAYIITHFSTRYNAMSLT